MTPNMGAKPSLVVLQLGFLPVDGVQKVRATHSHLCHLQHVTTAFSLQYTCKVLLCCVIFSFISMISIVLEKKNWIFIYKYVVCKKSISNLSQSFPII